MCEQDTADCGVVFLNAEYHKACRLVEFLMQFLKLIQPVSLLFSVWRLCWSCWKEDP